VSPIRSHPVGIVSRRCSLPAAGPMAPQAASDETTPQMPLISPYDKKRSGSKDRTM